MTQTVILQGRIPSKCLNTKQQRNKMPSNKTKQNDQFSNNSNRKILQAYWKPAHLTLFPSLPK